MRRILEAIDLYLWKAVAVLTGVVVLSMVGLSFTQVVMRLLFNAGLLWADSVLTHLVLWLALLGGTLATREGRQISIDLLTRIPNPKVRTLFRWLGGVFTVIVCFLLARGSIAFLDMQQDIGGFLTATKVPSWWAAVILPAGFSLIAVQVLLNLSLGRTDGFETEALESEESEVPSHSPETES